MGKIPKSSYVLDVFFDGHCRLCSAEIEMYRKKDVDHKIHWIDIADKNFNADHFGLDAKKVRQHMHAQWVGGKRVVGVDAFVAIWTVLPGYSFLRKVVTQPLLRPFFNLGYEAFTHIRPYLPKKKGVDCNDGTCAI
jgi:predicted DCC family thiol-disulfide oxidoreductase YuxK